MMMLSPLPEAWSEALAASLMRLPLLLCARAGMWADTAVMLQEMMALHLFPPGGRMWSPRAGCGYPAMMIVLWFSLWIRRGRWARAGSPSASPLHLAAAVLLRYRPRVGTQEASFGEGQGCCCFHPSWESERLLVFTMMCSPGRINQGTTAMVEQGPAPAARAGG